jgi:hypothetical protein
VSRSFSSIFIKDATVCGLGAQHSDDSEGRRHQASGTIPIL